MKNITFSIIKGLAIIAVVVGHCGVSQWTESFVNQWHLAAFFFVAGMCFKETHAKQPWQYIFQRIKSLYLPFIEFGILFLMLHNVLYSIYGTSYEYTLTQMGKEVFNLTIRFTSNESLMGAMWFCPALFFTSIIMMGTQAIIDRIKRVNKYYIHEGGLPIVVFTIGFAAIQFEIKSPYCIWQYMIVSFIMWMGQWFRRYINDTHWSVWTHLAIALGGFSLIAFATSYDFVARLQPTSINHESAIALIAIPAISGIAIYSASSLLKQTFLKNILAYIGDHSFSIMALHFLAFKIVNMIQISVYGYNIERLADFPVIPYKNNIGWCVFYVIVGVTLPLLLASAYKKIKE